MLRINIVLAARDEQASRETKHQRAWQSLATTTYGARVLPQAASTLFADWT